jgi:cystathionine beta-lyase
MAKKDIDLSRLARETRLVAATRRFSEHGMVNPAVYHASTVLFPTVEAYHARTQPYVYGRHGTPTSEALAAAVATVEGGFATKICPSGLAAITTTLLAFLKVGDHLLMPDSVYLPARKFCDGLLTGLGIQTTYYDPLIGAGIAGLMRPETRVVYLESPGSQTLEVQDVPSITAATHAGGALAVIDNTWSGGHYFDAFAHGCDISVQAATKYLVGHSDAMLGTITTTEAAWPQLAAHYQQLGQCAGPDDIYLTLRGIRTLDVRLKRHMENALEIAGWLAGRPEVSRVLYPALPGAPGHDLWKRDFTGASGLFSVVLEACRPQAVAAMLDDLSFFGMGASWGGYESLILPFEPFAHRSVKTFEAEGPGLRLHIGLENPVDRIADLDAGFARLNAAR